MSYKSQWSVGWAQADDEQSLLELFRKAFKAEMPTDQWRWKYANSDPLGTIVREDDKVVAFYGAMPRGIQLFGKQETAVQIVDVMVEPSRRRILTRSGPFFLSASTFLEDMVGPGKRYCYAFGFPNERANRLAEHLGLYAKVGRISEASWTPLPFKRSLAIKVRPFEESSLPCVDQLWQEMAGDLTELAVLNHDAAHIKYRYLEHPTISYLLVLVKQRFSGKPLGLLVLRDHGDKGVELMDMVASRQHLHLLVTVARRIVGRLQRPKLFAWLTQPVVNALAGSQYSLEDTDIIIPTCLWKQSEEYLKIRDRWWLMGGDTDYR